MVMEDANEAEYYVAMLKIRFKSLILSIKLNIRCDSLILGKY